MNTNEKFVITINRELGSGGRTVGRQLAQRLGVEFYDKAVIKGLQEKYGLSVKEIERAKGNDHGWWSEFKRRVNFGGYASTEAYYAPQPGHHAPSATTPCWMPRPSSATRRKSCRP